MIVGEKKNHALSVLSKHALVDRNVPLFSNENFKHWLISRNVNA